MIEHCKIRTLFANIFFSKIVASFNFLNSMSFLHNSFFSPYIGDTLDKFNFVPSKNSLPHLMVKLLDLFTLYKFYQPLLVYSTSSPK